jgi:serpin B
VDQLTKSHREFSFSLYRTLDQDEKSVLFSPYSIASSLSMVYMGARGETEQEIGKTLHLDLNRKQLAQASLDLNQSLLPVSDYSLYLANGLWIDQSLFVLSSFRLAMEKQFKAHVGMLNFSETEQALTAINHWTSDQTQGKITSLLHKEDINPLTRLVLTNALYFQGNWSTPFDPKLTQNAPFHPTPGTSLSLPTMRGIASFPYMENDLLQAVALPFKGKSRGGKGISMLILLPKSAENFSAMLDALSSHFSEWVSLLSLTKIDLKLPKFSLSSRYLLNEALESLGMDAAFTSDADLTGIDGMSDLSVNQVVHETLFILDEQGVIAQAATAAAIGLKAAPPTSPPLFFTANHPFLFLVLDMNTQEPLLMGKFQQ